MLRVGIVGAGLIGTKRARALARSGDARLVRVIDENAEKAAKLAQEFECQSAAQWGSWIASPEVDCWVVATTHNCLAPISLAALSAGKHVLAEKPMAINVEDADSLVQRAAENKLILKVGFNHRYHPGMAKAHAVVEEGRIGRLLFLRCRYGHGGRAGYDREWRADPKLSGGGELMDQGIHVLDLFGWFLGDFQEVYAMLGTFFWDMPVEDNAFCLLRTERGQTASLHASWTQWKNIFSFEAFGDRGYVTVDGLGGYYGRERLMVGVRPPEFGVPAEETLEFEGEDRSWDREWEDFSGAIREHRRPLGDGRDGWRALRLVQAAFESARQRSPVFLK